jgi:hypothetical protein
MKLVVQIEHRASSSRGKHEGESSFGLCDRLSRTRDNSQRQLPTDQDYAVSTREYQTDQSSLKTAPTAARSVLDKRREQRQQQTHRVRRLTRSLHIRPMLSLALSLVRRKHRQAPGIECKGSGLQVLWKPARRMARGISGLRAKVFQTKLVRRFSAMRRLMPRSMPRTSGS